MNCPLDNKRCYTKAGYPDGGVGVEICRHGKRYTDGSWCPAYQSNKSKEIDQK